MVLNCKSWGLVSIASRREARSSKLEARKPKRAPRIKHQCSKRSAYGPFRLFGFRALNSFRISCFGFRASPPPLHSERTPITTTASPFSEQNKLYASRPRYAHHPAQHPWPLLRYALAGRLRGGLSARRLRYDAAGEPAAASNQRRRPARQRRKVDAR